MNAFRHDLTRYRRMSGRSGPYCFMTHQGLWAIAEYRLSHWLLGRVRNRVLRKPVALVCLLLHKTAEVLTGIDLPPETSIGKGLYIGHFGGIIVSGSASIGEYCNLSHGVTIGVAGRADRRGAPVIGDRVYFGPGCVAIGPIRIGNDVAIGANAVVTKDLPDSAVAAGVPATVLSYRGSGDYVQFASLPEKSVR